MAAEMALDAQAVLQPQCWQLVDLVQAPWLGETADERLRLDTSAAPMHLLCCIRKILLNATVKLTFLACKCQVVIDRIHRALAAVVVATMRSFGVVVSHASRLGWRSSGTRRSVGVWRPGRTRHESSDGGVRHSHWSLDCAR